VLAPDGVSVPDLEVLPDEDDEGELSDDEFVPDAPASALAGAAPAERAAPMAARPKVKSAAVLAMRVLIIEVPFLEA
jgi:hypothetical protein